MGKYWLIDLAPQFLFNILLLSLHGLIYVISQLKVLKRALRDLYVVSLGQVTRRQNRSFWMDPERLKEVTRKLSKRPRHINIILMNGTNQRLEELSNLAIWSICLGTPYITLYDKGGKIIRAFLSYFNGEGLAQFYLFSY